MPELLALGAALCYASGSVVVKFATRRGSSTTGFLVGLLVTLTSIGTVALLTVDSWTMSRGSLVFFACAGLAGIAAGRSLSMWGVRDVGASVAIPVQCSVNPLIATAAGVLLFQETVGPGRIGAIALILVGIWLCARGGTANRPEGLLAAASRRPARLLVLIPLAAGTALACGDVLRKLALNGGADPVLGALVATTTAFIAWVVIACVRRTPLEPLRVSASLGWYATYGLLSSVAQILVVLALRNGDISTVSPILGSQPVIVIILSALVLRGMERLRAGTIVGAVVVFAGVALVAVT